MMLTIAIPTYNRNQTLLANISVLLPQITPACKLILFDNCSDEPVEETLRELLARFPAVNCEIVRNEANIGANANIVRCIERCRTPWVWVLGDDDKPQPNSVETILRHLEDYPDCVLINFATDDRRTHNFETRGIRELADELDTSADLPWISSSIYRADAFKRHLKFGYQYLYTSLPHVVLMLMAIGDAGHCCFSPARIVDSESRDTPPEQQWSLVNFALGYPILLELPFEPAVREKLVEKLLVTHRGDGFKLRFMMYQLLLMAIKHGDARNALYIYDQICHRRYYFDHRMGPRAERFAYRMMLRFPGVTAAIYRLVRRQDLGGQGQKLQDRYGRL